MKKLIFLQLLLVGACNASPDHAVTGKSAAPSASTLSDSAVLAGPMGKSIARGKAILIATRDSLPENVGSELRCSSCHLDAGTRKNGLLLAGAYSRYPQYRTRTGGVVTLEGRINDCFERSLNGRAIEHTSSAMTDLVAYMWFISRGVPVDGKIDGQGIRPLSVQSGDTLRGQAIFAANCVICHGSDGGGTTVAPPLWGAHSFNIGAAMGRLQTASSFIRYNMPLDRPGVLNDQQAADVAAYIGRRSRPDFHGKENDWPNGDAPPDVPYALKSAKSVTAAPTAAPDDSSCPANGLWAVCSIEKRLKQSGFVAQKTDSVGEKRAGFTVKPVAYKLNKSRLELYVYRDAAALQRDISKVDTAAVAPVFIRSANLAVLLFTDDGTQAERLSLALTAGAPRR